MQLIFVLFFIVFTVVAFLFFIRQLSTRRLLMDCFNSGSCVVSGMKGRGKDMLFCWVVNKRRKQYISNVTYSKRLERIPFNALDQFNIGGNKCTDFIDGTLHPYSYPYPDGVDFYISDAGVYFPSNEFSLLNKRYPSFPLFQAISRHLGDCNIHWNVQNINRLWDKAREQCDSYFFMNKCKVFRGTKIFRMSFYYYDRYDSCLQRVKPMKKRMGKQAKLAYDTFTANFGVIRKCVLWGKIPYRYDDRIFKTMLEVNSCVDESE